MLTKEDRQEIMNAIANGVRHAMSTYEERWLTARELCDQFQMLSPAWVRTYGHLLPRTRATVTDASGTEHHTGWAYPRNRIQQMIAEGKLDFVMTAGAEVR